MRRRRALAAAGIALVVVVTGWTLLRTDEPRVVIDLIDALDEARQVPGQYQVADLTLAGDTRRALLVDDHGRFIFPVTIPERAWLHVSIGQRPGAWEQESDGVIFIIGTWDEVVFDELLNFVVNPYHLPEDRRWHDVAIDLSKYAGRTLELRFILRSRDTSDGDLPAWGNPRIVVN